MVYKIGANISEHVSNLVQVLERRIKCENNTVVTDAQMSQIAGRSSARDLPTFLIGVVCDNTPGMSAIYAEAGTGRSVALFAATLVASKANDFSWSCKMNWLTPSDCFSGFPKLARQLPSRRNSLSVWQEKGIQLRLVVGDALDGGVSSDALKDILTALARDASEHGH